MRIRHAVIAAIMAGATAGTTMVVETRAPTTQTASTQSVDRNIEAINSAADPSTAINAYADAKAAEPGNLAVQQAFLRRMVGFQLPEMADAQAREIINRDPHDSLAWAVLAYMHAKQDM